MNQTTQMQPVNRLYKSRIFAMLYSDRKDLLDLYNAVSGKHYEEPGIAGNQYTGKCNLHVDA